MNGECKSYRLNDPMDWKEFKSMPDDLKITYIKLLRQKFNVPSSHIAKMFGISDWTISKENERLGIREGAHSRGRCTQWDKEGFYAWWHGVDALPTPVPEEPTEAPAHEGYFEIPNHQEREGIPSSDTFTEDDLPYEEPDPIQAEESVTVKTVPVCATPINGSMNFKCPADQALNTLAQILGKANCAISVMWKVIEEGGEEDA